MVSLVGVTGVRWVDATHAEVIISWPTHDVRARAIEGLAWWDAIKAAGTPIEAPRKDSFLARDFVAALTPADYAAIGAALAADPSFGLLWSALIAQGDAPIALASERAAAGIAALQTILGEARAAALFASIGIEI